MERRAWPGLLAVGRACTAPADMQADAIVQTRRKEGESAAGPPLHPLCHLVSRGHHLIANCQCKRRQIVCNCPRHATGRNPLAHAHAAAAMPPHASQIGQCTQGPARVRGMDGWCGHPVLEGGHQADRRHRRPARGAGAGRALSALLLVHFYFCASARTAHA